MMLLEHIMHHQPSWGATHEEIGWEMFLTQDARQAHSRGDRIHAHSRSLIALNVVAIVVNLYDRLSKQKCVCLYFFRTATIAKPLVYAKSRVIRGNPAKREKPLD